MQHNFWKGIGACQKPHKQVGYSLETSCCYLMVSHLKHSWQVLKYSTHVNFCSSSQNKTALCILPILTNATTASMWPFPNELVLPVLLLSSRLSFPNDVKWTWYLIYTSITNTSEIGWHQTYIKFTLCLSFLICYLHVTSILIKQYLIFSTLLLLWFCNSLIPLVWLTLYWTKSAAVPRHTS